jgi:hypothetical protein
LSWSEQPRRQRPYERPAACAGKGKRK